MFFLNPLLATDSYKLSHFLMYPEGITYLQSNFTMRGSRMDGITHGVHFGLQAWLKDLQESWEKFFAARKEDVVKEYKDNTETFVSPGFPLSHIEDLHDLGYLPLRFSGLPEGSLVPMRVPSITIENTHPDFPWLVNYVESDLSAGIWHPGTVATVAWDIRRVFNKAAKETGGAPEATDFQMHDFSYRGQVNREAAMASGAAHLLSSLGSDGVPTVPWVNYYYPGDNGLIAASVPATEHSVMCAGGEEDEIETFRRLLKQFPEGILSVVSDTWDFFRVLTVILPQLKDEIMSRNGKLVIRPDSGDPADIVCGTWTAPTPEDLTSGTPEQQGAIQILWNLFGGTENEKGFKELDSHIGLIYGDGMYKARIQDINERLAAKGFASTNWVAGIGSYSYQMMTRDNLSSAVKATYAIVNGVGRNLFKNPKTDDGTKKSATGKIAVSTDPRTGEFKLIEKAEPWQIENSRIQPVWENGKFIRESSFADVRRTLWTNTALLERTGVLA
jgi:nicotinamide phosphoribosyltransferase